MGPREPGLPSRQVQYPEILKSEMTVPLPQVIILYHPLFYSFTPSSLSTLRALEWSSQLSGWIGSHHRRDGPAACGSEEVSEGRRGEDSCLLDLPAPGGMILGPVQGHMQHVHLALSLHIPSSEGKARAFRHCGASGGRPRAVCPGTRRTCGGKPGWRLTS